MMNGLIQINVELSSKCSKNCGMCGRRKYDRVHGTQDYGDMPFDMVRAIANEIPSDIVIATHWNGESMMQPFFGGSVDLFKLRNCFVYTVTNGKHLVEKIHQLDGNLDVVSVSIIEDDKPSERDEQYAILVEFLEKRKTLKPRVVLRYVGNIDDERFDKLGLPIVHRTLHKPEGSIGYRRKPPIPENHVCREMMSGLAIDRYGNVSPCVRFDPLGEMRLGNIMETPLDAMWNGEKRRYYKQMHMEGRRSELPFCGDRCEYFGIPTGD